MSGAKELRATIEVLREFGLLDRAVAIGDISLAPPPQEVYRTLPQLEPEREVSDAEKERNREAWQYGMKYGASHGG